MLSLLYSESMKIINWFKKTVGETSVNAVAIKAGLSQPTLARQIKDQTLGYEQIVKIARAYDVDPIQPLITAGLLTKEDIRKWNRTASISEFTDRELADEVWKRMQEGRLDENGDPAEVHELPVVSQVSDTNIDIEELRREAAASRKNMEAEQEYWE